LLLCDVAKRREIGRHFIEIQKCDECPFLLLCDVAKRRETLKLPVTVSLAVAPSKENDNMIEPAKKNATLPAPWRLSTLKIPLEKEENIKRATGICVGTLMLDQTNHRNSPPFYTLTLVTKHRRNSPPFSETECGGERVCLGVL
jgi:hypothetical protein